MIGDLLAQINGEGGTKTPSSAQPPKRKADNELSRGPALKTPRTTSTTPPNGRDRNGGSGNGLATSRAPVDARSNPVSRPPTTSSRPGASQSFSSSTGRHPGGALPSRPSLPGVRNGNSTSSTTNTTTASSSSSALKPAPKKGSYQEIMERAKANQAAMAQMGKIQHKPLEKGMTKRERMLNGKGEEPSRAGVTKKGMGMRPLGSRPPLGSRGAGATPRDARNGANGAGRNGVKTPSTANGKAGTGTAARRKGAAAAAKEEEKQRPKKAATATTGYQGTARPRPSSSSSAPGGSGSGGSGAAGSSGASHRRDNAPRMPFGNPRRSRYDEEYDDEMDDFIDYDEDEEETAAPGYGSGGYDRGRGRPGYYNDYDDEEEEDESDMEAGMSDIDEEEQRAERQARREDAEQEALERRLKLEKEQRKRQLLSGASGGGSSRR